MCEVFPTWPDAPNQNLIIIPIIEFDLLSLVFAAMPSLKLTSAVPLICSSVFVISSPSQEPKKPVAGYMYNENAKLKLPSIVTLDFDRPCPLFLKISHVRKGYSSILSHGVGEGPREGERERVGRAGYVKAIRVT